MGIGADLLQHGLTMLEGCAVQIHVIDPDDGP